MVRSVCVRGLMKLRIHYAEIITWRLGGTRVGNRDESFGE